MNMKAITLKIGLSTEFRKFGAHLELAIWHFTPIHTPINVYSFKAIKVSAGKAIRMVHLT
jgi:hypothetical protein